MSDIKWPHDPTKEAYPNADRKEAEAEEQDDEDDGVTARLVVSSPYSWPEAVSVSVRVIAFVTFMLGAFWLTLTHGSESRVCLAYTHSIECVTAE